MAIGSESEIGIDFTTWGKMSKASRENWFNHIRNDWGPDLLTGYGTLIQITKVDND